MGCVLSVGNVKGIIPEIVIINILLLIKCNIVMVAWCMVSAGLQVHVIVMVVVGALRSWWGCSSGNHDFGIQGRWWGTCISVSGILTIVVVMIILNCRTRHVSEKKQKKGRWVDSVMKNQAREMAPLLLKTEQRSHRHAPPPLSKTNKHKLVLFLFFFFKKNYMKERKKERRRKERIYV